MVVEKYITVKEEIEIIGATLLSVEEAKLLSSKERKYYKEWWLRTPGYIDLFAAFVYVENGDIAVYGYNVDEEFGVRPALILKNLEKTDFQIGDIFAIRGYKFKIISRTLAWMYDGDIGCMEFRENWKAADANFYDKSDIKKYVDKWFEEKIRRLGTK